MTRLLRIGFLAAFEATLVALPLLALTTIVLSWPGLWSTVMLGRLADEIGRRLRWPFHRMLLIAAPVIAACWLSWLTFGLDPRNTLAALQPGAAAEWLGLSGGTDRLFSCVAWCEASRTRACHNLNARRTWTSGNDCRISAWPIVTSWCTDRERSVAALHCRVCR
ncbi:hypothetical protein [Chloroflexus sp. Y-396-1]|uniref:hypothetical protein n=1 Tax=Chloroflexus sp. Y-396-1 TaxID=867845 RepID=UPI001E5E7EA2|nr:hypothetical protein [Chloroflexus sp. Y-396-1]